MQTLYTSDVIQSSFVSLWGGVVSFVPRLMAAAIVLFIGLIIAVLLGKIAYHIVRVLRLDDALRRIGFRDAWEKSGFTLNSPLFFYGLVKWFFIVVVAMAVSNILGLEQVSIFLQAVVLYLPNVIVAVLILLAGLLIGKTLEQTVVVSVRAAGLISANFLGLIVRWVVFVFSFLIALSQLDVAESVIQIFIIGVVTAFALAVGLAFGLGGVKHADELISSLRKKIKD